MSGSRNIPSAADFERADRLMAHRTRGLDRVRDRVLAHFRDRGELHECFVFDVTEVAFRAYVFYEKEENIEAAQRTGLDQRIVEFVYDALEQEGRGNRKDIKVAFEFDSDENVQKKFKGSYWLRLK
jgi:hypothetical protein